MSSQDGTRHPIHVKVDPYLEDLIPRYLENRRKDIEKLGEAVAARDFEQIRILGHSMAGSGGGYGFREITVIGRALESAARERDVETIRARIQDLREYLEDVVISFA